MTYNVFGGTLNVAQSNCSIQCSIRYSTNGYTLSPVPPGTADATAGRKPAVLAAESVLLRSSVEWEEGLEIRCSHWLSSG